MTRLAIFLLGSNLGDRAVSIERACQFLTSQIGSLDRKSTIYESPPWGVTLQPDFLNQVVGIHTVLEPRSVLEKCLAFENAAGRIRGIQWGPRTIDIDLLYYADRIIDEAGLQVPHPGIPSRRFTLAPLCEAYPDLIHPVTGSKQTELLKRCADPGEVKPANVHA